MATPQLDLTDSPLGFPSGIAGDPALTTLPGGFTVDPSSLTNPSGIPNISGPGNLSGPKVHGSAKAPFVPIDPNATERLAVGFDTTGYNASDAMFAKLFPQLVAGRQYGIQSALTNIEGGQDPFVTNELKRAGLGDESNLGSNEFQQARNLGEPILEKQNRDRAYFTRLLADNPMRSFGLNSGDIARIAASNTGAGNQFVAGRFGSRLAQFNANVQQQIQNNEALIGGLGKIGGTIGSAITDYALQPGGYGGYPSSGGSAYTLASGGASGGADNSGLFAGSSDTSSSGGL